MPHQGPQKTTRRGTFKRGPGQMISQLYPIREDQEPVCSDWILLGRGWAAAMRLLMPACLHLSLLQASLHMAAQVMSSNPTSDHVTPLVKIPQWLSITRQVKIQICHQGELDSSPCPGTITLRPVSLGSPGLLLVVGLTSGRHLWELRNLEGNEGLAFSQLPPCWVTVIWPCPSRVRSCPLPLPTSLRRPWGTALSWLLF